MKKILNFILILCICFFGFGCNIIPDDYPFDNLGGGGIADDEEEERVTGDDVISNEEVEKPTDDKVNIELDGAIVIDLNDLESTSYYSYDNDVLKINAAGKYILIGTLYGAVEVSGDPDSVELILNNVTIETLDSQACAAIVFKSNNGNRKLTILENSENFLADSVGDTTADGDNAVIQAKKSSLIINGSGTLTLTSKGEETTGIKVKKNLEIYNTTININVNDNGIKSGELLVLNEVNLNLKVGNDGIKTDVEATTAEEGDKYTKNPFAGYMYIYNSNIKIESGDDGISANSLLKINNTNQHTIEIITHNGAPNNITEYSSNNADGKGIRVSGIVLVDEAGTETDLASQTEDNYYLVISGGKYIINSNDDAITSKGNLLIDNGDITIASGDDGIHAEYQTIINDGNILIERCYEGIEGATVEIYGGTIALTSMDDGINAANSDLKNYAYNIYVGGGELTINATGDGIDSNGTVQIDGGKIIVYGPVNGGNGALDSDRGIKVTGGVLVALGSAGMVETPATNSTQYCISYNMPSSVTGELIIEDADGNELISVNNPKKYQSIVVTLPEFKNGKIYTIKVNNTATDIKISSIITKVGNSFGSGGRPGGRP